MARISARRTALAGCTATALLMLGSTATASSAPEDRPEPPAIPGVDWYALCVTYEPPAGHLPKVCVPDLTK